MSAGVIRGGNLLQWISSKGISGIVMFIFVILPMRHSSCKTIQVPDVVREGSLGARCAENGRSIFVGDRHVHFCYSA